jgi:hypothetical protein
MYIRKIKWTFSDMVSTNYSLNDKFFFSKGQWSGLMFSLSGLGLSKVEREFFKCKRFEFKNSVTLYFLKWYASYEIRPYKEHYRNVDITEDTIIFSTIRVKHKIKDTVKKYINNPINTLLHKVLFKQQYDFGLDRYWEGDYKFSSDLLSAFQLASNYEADLYFRGRLVFSPLGLSYEENAELVKKYLGWFYSDGKEYKLREYKNPWSDSIKNYQRIKEAY